VIIAGDGILSPNYPCGRLIVGECVIRQPVLTQHCLGPW